jgi:hypothetical protein
LLVTIDRPLLQYLEACPTGTWRPLTDT